MEWLERLRDFKNETNETHKTIADKTDIPQTTVEKIFCGRTKDTKLNMMKKIVHCLNHTLDDLVEEPNEISEKLENVSDKYKDIELVILDYNKIN